MLEKALELSYETTFISVINLILNRPGITLHEISVEDDMIMSKPLSLWDRVWGCAKGIGSAEEAELELDREEKEFWRRRLLGAQSSR